MLRWSKEKIVERLRDIRDNARLKDSEKETALFDELTFATRGATEEEFDELVNYIDAVLKV